MQLKWKEAERTKQNKKLQFKSTVNLDISSNAEYASLFFFNMPRNNNMIAFEVNSWKLSSQTP